MSTQAQQAEAKHILDTLGDKVPSSLRGPLRAVITSTELEGTAEDVINFGWDAVRSVQKEQA